MTDDESLIATMEANGVYLAQVEEPSSDSESLCSECEEACGESSICYRCQCALQILNLY